MENNLLTFEERLKKYFDGMIVKKSPSLGIFSALSIPGFIRDWFVRKYADKNGEINERFVAQKIKEILPKATEWNLILDQIMNGQTVKFLGKIKVSINIKSRQTSFELTDFGISFDKTHIPERVWHKCKGCFLRTNEDVWGIIELGYDKISTLKGEQGRVTLESFTPFRPYNIDLKYYKESRKFFSTDEWINLLLGAVDYNSAGFASLDARLAMLTRLLPFVEKRLNLIELAPKGTGKSYLFSQISKRGWLSTGGVMTRAKMFFDMYKKEAGLVSMYDYIALDEIATIRFPDAAEIQGAMKGFLESGAFTVGNQSGKGNAGIILLGNIAIDDMNTSVNMFKSLPAVFADSALIDRFHGFLEGWRLPRMSEELKMDGWALNTEYFAEIMHELREDAAAPSIITKLLVVPKNSDTRDVTAIKRIASAFIKLLFPHWTKPSDIDREEFLTYCLQPAIHLRSIIKQQLIIIDREYKNYPIPSFDLKD